MKMKEYDEKGMVKMMASERNKGVDENDKVVKAIFEKAYEKALREGKSEKEADELGWEVVRRSGWYRNKGEWVKSKERTRGVA